MSEWVIKKISDIASVIDSLHKTPSYVSSGYPMVRVTDIKGGYLDLKGTFKVSESTYKDFSRKYRPKSGDLVFSRVGTCGLTSFVKDDALFCLGQNTVFIVPNVNCYFLFYFLSSPLGKNQIESFVSGTTQKTISLVSINNIEVLTPPLDEQKQIADVLSCLDCKIENLRRQNETLEAIAQTLFKHWFIDFEFPDADGKPYKSSGGEMIDSAIGDIPEGWHVGKLGQYLNIKHGYAFKGEYITTEETDKILLTPVNFKIGGGFNDSKYKYYSDEYYLDEYVLKKRDLTVTMTDLSKEGDTLGYPAFIPEAKGKVFLHNQRIGKVETDKIDKTFLYFLLCRREYRSHILGTASGSTVRHTSPSRICEYSFAIPDFQLINKFSDVATVIIDKILINFEQIQTLTKTRDALLPKLMSGQLRVKE